MKFLFIPFALISFTFFAQNLKSEDITYNYVKLPTNPLNPKPESYSTYVTASYEEENKKILAQYEADKITNAAEADALASRTAAREALLTKLGITAEEAQLLLGGM